MMMTMVQVLLGDGRLVNANANENADLYRALKGGGSNFGISYINFLKLDILTITLRHRNKIRSRNAPSNKCPIHNKPVQSGRLHRNYQGHDSRAAGYGDGSESRPVYQF